MCKCQFPFVSLNNDAFPTTIVFEMHSHRAAQNELIVEIAKDNKKLKCEEE